MLQAARVGAGPAAALAEAAERREKIRRINTLKHATHGITLQPSHSQQNSPAINTHGRRYHTQPSPSCFPASKSNAMHASHAGEEQAQPRSGMSSYLQRISGLEGEVLRLQRQMPNRFCV